MTQHTLLVTLDGPEIKETGVLAEDFERVLTGVRTAMRLLVEHLGGRTPGPGQPPAWVRDQSRLRLAPTRAGSFIAELSHEPPTNAQLPFENQGQAAMAALCDWDGSEGSTLPISVTGCLYELAGDLSNDTQLWLGTAVKPRRVAVRRPDSQGHLVGEAEEALLQGWLKEVNWHRGTAQLHSDSGDYVRLRFDTSLAEEMQRLATQYIQVRGSGSFTQKGDWQTVQVRQLDETRSWSDPFDLETFRNDTTARVFAPGSMQPIDLSDEEWEAFSRSVHEGRGA